MPKKTPKTIDPWEVAVAVQYGLAKVGYRNLLDISVSGAKAPTIVVTPLSAYPR